MGGSAKHLIGQDADCSRLMDRQLIIVACEPGILRGGRGAPGLSTMYGVSPSRQRHVIDSTEV